MLYGDWLQGGNRFVEVCLWHIHSKNGYPLAQAIQKLIHPDDVAIPDRKCLKQPIT
jgi:hypothetical protein